MRRYLEKILSIRKLRLEYTTNDQEMYGRIDGWLGIALQNQVETGIASKTLKELGIHDCYELINAVIDAPKLDTFCYNGDLQLSSGINGQSKYNAYYLHLNIANFDNRALVRIKNLLRQSKGCKVLSVILNDAHEVPESHKLSDAGFTDFARNTSEQGFGSFTQTVRRNSLVVMAVDGNKTTSGQLNSMDRLSDLPDSIIHHIISFLGTQEACRTTILAKRWVHIWPTGLILDFRPQFFVPKIDGVSLAEFFKSFAGPWTVETVEKLVNFIETTMRRYSEKNLSIRKFRLDYPTIDQEMAGRIDRWLRIALRNQVEQLTLSVLPQGPPSYELPAILFMAKSLISMKLFRVRMPYFETLKLISLRILKLTRVYIDENMLLDIIMSCPLKILNLDMCSGLQNISIPCCSRLESLYVAETVPVGGTVEVDTSSIQHFSYLGDQEVDPFPVILAPASRKNLRVLHICCALIVDDFFDKLMSELPSIENMEFSFCTMPINVNIASQTLKELDIDDCYGMINLVIQAPNLNTFRYNGGLLFTSMIYNHNKYDAHFRLTISNLDTGTLIGIKNLLCKSKCCCKVLSITLMADAPKIEFDKDQLYMIDDGSPCDVEELHLSLGWNSPILDESSCGAVIDGLLWCRPDILSLTVTLLSDNTFTRLSVDDQCRDRLLQVMSLLADIVLW
ncbi:hypothetical protein KSS87_007849 [Heliosperma pusillum]|nr:hypothetical protein KSS87_007849 [Heliosperma pusillum]